MLRYASDYDSLVSGFHWQIPERYNIGVDVCDRWAEADPERPAILDVAADGQVTVFSYRDLREASNRLAKARPDRQQ